jgi:hypothetical protein
MHADVQCVIDFINSSDNLGEATITSSHEYVRKIERAKGKRVSHKTIEYVAIDLLHNTYKIIDYQEVLAEAPTGVMFPFNLRSTPLLPQPTLSDMHLEPTKRLTFELLKKSHNLKTNTFALKYILEEREHCFVILHGSIMIGYVVLKHFKYDFSPLYLEIFETKKGYGTEVMQELERNMYGKTIFLTSLDSALGFWKRLGYKQTTNNQLYKICQ